MTYVELTSDRDFTAFLNRVPQWATWLEVPWISDWDQRPIDYQLESDRLLVAFRTNSEQRLLLTVQELDMRPPVRKPKKQRMPDFIPTDSQLEIAIRALANQQKEATA